jgi:hypothetical protein
MTAIATAIIGSAVVGAGVSAYASNQATKAQVKGANYAADLQLQSQQEAIAASQKAYESAAAASVMAAEMMAGATTEAAMINAEAAKYAADQQMAAARESLAQKKTEWERMQQNMTPYLKSGGEGLNQLSYGLGLNGYNNGSTDPTLQSGYLQKAFGMEDFQADPGYSFRLQEGIKALDRSASARGNLLSGSTLKGITQYGQDFASNEYQNAYNRYTQNQNTRYNQLASLTNMGQNTAVQMGNAGMQYADSYGATLMGATTAANAYNVNAANQNANALIANAAYAGQQGQYAANAGVNNANTIGSYGIAGANALGNAALVKANANASSYMNYGQIGNSLANALGNYYGNYYGSSSGMTGYNPSSFNFNPSPYTTNYGSYSL